MRDAKDKGGEPPSSSSSSSSSAILRPPQNPPQDPFPRRREAFEAIDLSLDGILYPKSSEEEEDEEEEEDDDGEEDEDEENEGSHDPKEDEDGGETDGGGGALPDKEALDRVLETFLAPSSSSSSSSAPSRSNASEAPTWPSSFLGPEMADFARSVVEEKPNTTNNNNHSASSSVVSPTAAPSSFPSPWKPFSSSSSTSEEGASLRSPRSKAPSSSSSSSTEVRATPRPSSSSSLSSPDFLHLPILPLNPAYLAARTRQLLDVEENPRGFLGTGQGGSSVGPEPLMASSSSSYISPSSASSFLYSSAVGDPSQTSSSSSSLRIKEEGTMAPKTGGDFSLSAAYLASKSNPQEEEEPPPPPPSSLECILYKGDAASGTCSAGISSSSFGGAPPFKVASSSCLVPSSSNASPQAAFYQPFLPGPQPLGPPSLKDGLPQFYSPYLGYIRSDTEAGQSPQYAFESLPPKICLICGDEASGCHYGVLTCGSCKVFFKRAMEGQHNYLCAGRNDCIVDKIRRKNCPACRLRKCCQAGMVLGGRKFKKFNKVKVLRALDVVALQQPATLPNESQALAQRLSFSPSQDIQFIPPLISVLQGIEPEVVYAGYDNTQPETPSGLMTSLNQLCERQLLCVVKWSKSLPGFRNLHIDDQITLIQYSWMSLMVFAMGWRSYKHVSGQMLYFAPDLILNEQRMKESSFYSLCLSMWQIPQEFVKLQVSSEEFLCMKALLLLSTVPLEGLRSQSQFDEMRSSYIRELVKAIGLRQKGVVASSQRFYQLTKLMDSMHDLVKQLHLYCLNTFLQSRTLSVEFPEMMSEVIAAQLPKILAGMVKPLLFHKK